MGLLLQGGSANIADIQFEGGAGNKTVTIPKEGGKLAVTDSPAFTGTPTAPTPTAQDNSTKIATTAYVDNKMVRGTAVTASGTSIDFTGIPNWARKITVIFNGVKLSGSSQIVVRIGSGSIVSSGYSSGAGRVTTVVSYSTSGTAFTTSVNASGASEFFSGNMLLALIGNNTWVESFSGGEVASFMGGGRSPVLAGALDRIRITTANGTDTFTNGTINIMYEG